MSSLTGQESSETQPDNPVNPGTTFGKDPSAPSITGNKSSSGLSSDTVDKSSHGQDNASGMSEHRSSAQNTKQTPQESGDMEKKTGSGSLIDSVEKSVHDRGEAEHSRADARD